MRNAAVTGANRGLGLELCKQLSDGKVYDTIYAICRKTSDDLTALAASTNGAVKVVEDIQITEDTAPSALKKVFETDGGSPTPIHLLIHNAGAYGPPEAFDNRGEMMASQSLSNITAERMRFAFELNTLAPLFITQALVPNLEAAAKESPSQVAIITSAIGSIDDNTSGGHYAYRAAKAAVNMVGKSLSIDLKGKNVAVSLIHPGFIFTGFAGKDAERMNGQRDVDEGTKGILDAIAATNLETSGTFYHGNYGEGVKIMKW